jgi:hypothetical protein
MTEEQEFYRTIGKIYERCLPALETWAATYGAVVKEVEITREPAMAPGEVAFLWVYADLELSDQQDFKMKAKVVVALSSFLEAKSKADMGTAFRMVMSTFGFGEPNTDFTFHPFIFTDQEPRRFVALLNRKGISVGPGGVNMFTPTGAVVSLAPPKP